MTLALLGPPPPRAPGQAEAAPPFTPSATRPTSNPEEKSRPLRPSIARAFERLANPDLVAPAGKTFGNPPTRGGSRIAGTVDEPEVIQDVEPGEFPRFLLVGRPEHAEHHDAGVSRPQPAGHGLDDH